MKFNNSILQNATRYSFQGVRKNISLANRQSLYSGVFNQLSSKISQMKDSVTLGKTLSAALCQDIDIFDDDMDLNDELASSWVNIDEEIYNTLFECFTDTTLTDSNGWVYQFKKIATLDSDDGYAICTQNGHSREQDLFLRKTGDQYQINNRVRSIGFTRRSESYTAPTDIVSLTMEIMDWYDLQYLDSVLYSLDQLEVGSNILDKLNSALSDFDDSGSTILEACTKLCNHKYSQYNRDYGHVEWIHNITRSMLLSSDLNECMLDASEQLLNGSFNPSNFNAAYDVSTSSGTSKFRNGIAAAYNSAGVIGAIKYILSYFNVFDDARDDSTGRIVLTDNNSYIPSEYICGIITKIVGGVVSVIGVVISMLQPAVGIALSSIGSLLLTIPQAVNYDYENSTTASIVDNDKSLILPYSTIACFQTIILKDDLLDKLVWNQDLRRTISGLGSTTPAMVLNVPGGCLLIGEYDNNHFAFEFHPGFVNAPFVNLSIDGPYHDKLQVLDDGDTHIVSLHDINFSAENIMQLYFDYGTALNLSNNDLGVLSADNDNFLRATIIRNAYLFKMWLILMFNYDDLSLTFFDENNGRIYIGDGVHNSLVLSIISWDPTQSEVYDFWSSKACRPLLSVFTNPTESGWQYQSGDWIRDFDWNDTIELFNSDDLQLVCDDGGSGIIAFSTPGNVTSGSSILYQYDHDQSMSNELYSIVSNGYYVNDIVYLNGQYQWGNLLPKYRRSTLLLWTIASIATVAVAAIATVVVSVSVSKWRRNKRIQNQMEVEKAWENYKQNPSDDTYNAYIKSVKRNNRWSAITGGTKYSKDGFWNAASTDTSETATSRLSQARDSLSDYFLGTTEYSINDVAQLIKG